MQAERSSLIDGDDAAAVHRLSVRASTLMENDARHGVLIGVAKRDERRPATIDLLSLQRHSLCWEKRL